ncbi:hypothetical protein [Thiofilum flexile]|uniref:hypothetical protein n=1 Tax=Thiofilum flexile TaxID=125627 RepID=UPI0003807A0B|nr:hypothetical protein [Thiofilum flexile]
MKYLLLSFILFSPFIYADDTNYEEKILGTWSCSEMAKEKDNIVSLLVDVDYVRNGRSNLFGKVSLDMITPEKNRVKLDYNISASGKWEIKENKYLIETTEEIKTVNLTNPLIDKYFKLEDFFPKNISVSSEIIQLDSNVFTTKGESDGKIGTCKKKTTNIIKLKDSENIIYLITYNKNGAILKNSSGETIYLGTSCDSFSQQSGAGKWGYANDGMLITLGEKMLSFPNQKLNIQDCNL